MPIAKTKSKLRLSPKKLTSCRTQGRTKVSCIGIAGVGLLGGSIAARLLSQSKSLRIIGVDRPSVIKKAISENVITDTSTSLSRLLESCQLIILSAPGSVNRAILTKLAAVNCKSDAVIVDTSSTQSTIAQLSQRLNWKNDAMFIAGHPMAGREQGGLANRDAHLFEGHPFFFDASVKLSAAHKSRIFWLTQSLGAQAMFVDNDVHDAIMADISHLPQIISTAIGAHVSSVHRDALSLAGTGLKSMIRLGGSPYDIWRDVFTENKANILRSLDDYIASLKAMRQAISDDIDQSAHFRLAQENYRCLW